MPPSAIARSVRSAMSRASTLPARACSRSRNSSSQGRGNFGASPNPLLRQSNASQNCVAARTSASLPGTFEVAAVCSTRRSCVVIASADWSTLSRSARPDAADLLEDVDESGPSPPRGRRKVGAAVEGLQIRRQPDAHRPAARSGGRLHEGHVDAIDVGALLAVDLDGDEVLVEHRGDCVVLERLVLHDVAPVARGVADGEEDRLVLRRRLRERLVAPRKPVDGILRVLQQVGTALAGQPVHRSIIVDPREPIYPRFRCRISAEG